MGHYFDPRVDASAALEALGKAYEENRDSHVGSLILTAIDAVTRLTSQLMDTRLGGNVAEDDPHELNEYNSAV